MRLLLFVLMAFALLLSCGNEEKPASVLNDPPFVALTDSIKLVPNNAALYYKRGVLLYQNNQKELAQSDIQNAWNLQPTEEFGLSLTTILKEKSADSALAFLERAVQKLPQSIALQIGLARGHQAKNNSAKALAITNSILQQYPGQLDALTLQAELLKDEKPDEALAKLEKAHSLVPSDPALAYELAFAYAEAKNAKTLLLTDSLIKAKAPELEKTFYTRGLYFANTGKTAEALAAFDKAIGANYNFLDAYLDKGQLLYRNQQYAAAAKVFQKGLEIRATEAQFYLWLAKTQLAMGDKQQAKLNFQRAYGLDKELTEAKAEGDKL